MRMFLVTMPDLSSKEEVVADYFQLMDGNLVFYNDIGRPVAAYSIHTWAKVESMKKST